MSDTCPKCGAAKRRDTYGPATLTSVRWLCGTSRDDEGYTAESVACLKMQLSQLREQLAKAESEAKRYREAWASVRKQWDNEATIAEGWNVPSGDRLASLLRQCIDDMNDLIPPAEQ